MPIKTFRKYIFDALYNLMNVNKIKIIYLKGMMVAESVNEIFGRGLNPYDNSRTVGGSSGGEAG